jgi:ribonuclease VapC
VIVIDTSAMMAIAQSEPTAQDCLKAIAQADRLLMSAVPKIELLIVAARRSALKDIELAMSTMQIEVIPVTEATIIQVTAAYDQWGKDIHPAALNICDCFAYPLAMDQGCPLLLVGDDFAKTDVVGVL